MHLPYSRLASLLVPMALALSCAPAPSDTESKASPVTDAPALATVSTSSALLYGPAERPFCGDTDEAGMSYELSPYDAPPRPLWSSVDIPHPTDTLTRPTFDDDGVVNGSETIGLLNLPTYRNITHNLNLLQSLQFMISLVQNLANTLDDASEYVAEGEYVDDAIGWAGGQVIPQTVGHCVCVGSCAPSGCNPTAILDRVEDAIDTIVNDLNFEDVLTEFLTEQLEPVIAHLEDLEDYITNLFTDGNLLSSIVGTTIQNLLEDALADAIPLLPDPTVCDGVFNGTWTPDIDAALENALGLIQDAFDADVAAIQNVIDTWNGAISPLLPEIKDTVVAIIDAFQGVDGITDLLNFNPQALITQIEGVVDQVNDAMPQIESAIESVTTLWDDLTGLEATLNALGDSVLDQVLTDLTGNPNTAACFQALIDSGAIAELGPGDFSFGGLADAFGDALQTQWDDLLAQVQPIQDDLEAMINGIGQNATTYLTGLLEDAKDELVNAALAGCYARTMRSDCYDFCDPNGTIPPSTAPDSCFLWMPVDFLESPEGAVGAVASGALWVLKQVGFLDGLTQWLNDNVNDLLSGALGDVADALGTFGETLDRINAFMAKAFTYIDLFTEGYHLGAYTELRPDLHICIGYAGHGAYAQMGGLGGDNFSVGARYSSHNVSKENRVQFRSGGFACSAFGHEISILPGIELNAQIQGFKLWDIREPFGIPINLPISADVLARLDAFATATDDGVGAPFDLPVDGSGSIPFGAFIVRDLHPVPNSEAIQAPGNDHIWPRREVFDVFTPEMTPAAPDWEDSSIAVVSAGVNLPLVLDPPRKELPAITIVPGILSAIPWFDISAGVEWKHETDMMRGKIQEAVNGNLPESLQLDEADFERNMHAMAPDDLTADNGTYVFVEPGLGVDVFLGFNIWKIRIGAYASLGLYVNIKPGGTGGILDLNSALSDTLLHSNPPPEAPCEPVIDPIVTETCNSPLLGGAPEPGYSCRSGDSSCCIKATFDPPAGAHQEYSACVDDWTGLDKKACEEFNAVAGDVTDTFVQILAQAPGYSDKLDGLLEKLATLGVGEKSIIATWNEGVRCEDSECGKDDTIDGGGPVVTTAILDLESLSECETHGYCILEDETVHHDVTEPECSDLLNGDDDGNGSTDDAQCATVRFTQVDLGDMVCALADDDVAGTTGEVRCWTPGTGWTTALSGDSPAPYDHRVSIECDSERCSWMEDTGVSGAVNYAHGANVFGSSDPSSCADPAVDCDFPAAPMFDSTIGHEGTVGLDPFTLRLQWEDEFCQTNAGNPVPTNPQRCTSSYLAITLGCGSASMTCDPTSTASASTFQQVEGDADSLCGLSAKGFAPTGTMPAWNATGEARPGSEALCAWPRLAPQVPVLTPGPVTCAGAACPPGYVCSEDAELAPTCVLPFNAENYRRTLVAFGDGPNADFVDVASAGNHIACAIHAVTNPTEPLSITCKGFNADWNVCGQFLLTPPQGQWIDIEPAGVCTMCALSADRETIACWGDEVFRATGAASAITLQSAPGVPFVDMGGMSRRADWLNTSGIRPYAVCGVTEDGKIVCNNAAYEPPPVPMTSCDGDPAGASGSNLTGPPGFYPYQCYQATTYEITDWTGDGCHPLQHGFPTACGCADDGDCSSDAGETCDTDSGKCQNDGEAVECACEETADCPAGRICSSGSCARACSANTDCAASAECVSGVCQPKNGIPWAETVTWGMQNVEAPMHTISSYAFSEIYATLIFTLGVGVEASFKLFGKVRKWTLFEFNDAWDIGSTWKGWYQPGLEARYQDECSDPALQTPVTNRFPRSLTSNPYDAAFDTAGVELFRNCPNGGVCRYPEDLPASITPHPAQPWAYADGNAGNVEQFIAWCKDDMKLHKENPDPTNPEDLVNGLIDTYNWGQDIGFTLYAENQPCIDGQPVTAWMADLMPTYDAAGNMTDEGSLGTETCKYVDPQTGVTHTFPCKDMTMHMMRIWGCLDRTKNLWSGSLWDEFSELRHSTNPDGTPHEWLDVDLTFWPTPGSPMAQEYDPAMMKTVYRLYFDFGLPWGLNSIVGQRWLETVSTCFDDRYLDPAETKCECTTNADCDESKGETCGPDGGCLVPSTNALGMTSWKVKECPIVSIVVEVGQCCGDGVVQSTPVQVVGPAAPGSAEYTTHHCDLPASAEDPVCAGLWYVEECDAGPDGSATCTPGCKVIEAAPNGACCAQGACYENLDAATCKMRHSGVYYAGTTCAALDYCESPPETRAACCLPSGGCSVIVAAECARAQGVWHSGLNCQQVQCTANVSGACCVGESCQTYPSANICSEKGGVWLAEQSCSTTSVCQRKAACCLPNGTCNDLPPGICHQKGGTSTPGQLCSQVTCPGTSGGCGGLPVSVSDVISRRPGYVAEGPGIEIGKTSWSPTATGELTLTVTVTGATIGKAPGQLQIQVSVDGKPVALRRDLQPIRLKGISDGSHTLTARLVKTTGEPLGNPQSVAVRQVSSPTKCATAADCPSGGACTTALCTSGRCVWRKTPNCCASNDDCRFGLVCDAGQCVACASDTDCNDGNACTTECCSDAGTCYSEAVPGCCKTNADCNDQDACTADACVQGQCKNTPSPDPLCCDADSDCDSGDPCQPSFCANVSIASATGIKAKTKFVSLRRCKLGPVVPGCCSSDKGCDDGNACTKDQCAQNQCVHASVVGCCDTAKDCDDGNKCTSDFCDGGKCIHKEAPVEPGQICCNTSKDCDDGDACTLDVCNPKGACQHIAKKDCCSSDKACDDGNACTVNRCNLATRKCVTQSIKGCCSSDAQCDDGNACTKNYCDRNVCFTAKIPGCCDVAADCNDGNVCTTDLCLFGSCTYGSSKVCCATHLDCGKTGYCSAGTCKPLVQPGQVCSQDAACLTGNCLTGCSTPLCAPSGETAGKWLWAFDTLDGWPADPAASTTVSLTTPGAQGSPGAITIAGSSLAAILHTTTDFRVLSMVSGSLDQPTLDPEASASIETAAEVLEVAKGVIELQLFGSDGWVIVRRDVPNGIGATTLIDGGWVRHGMAAVKAGNYGPSVPKPGTPTLRLAVSGPKTVTLDNLRLAIPARLPKACCETDLTCGDGAVCADGACVPK